MNARPEILTGSEITTGRRKPSEIVAEYEAKREALEGALSEYEAAGSALKAAATIGGTWGNVTLDTGRGIYLSNLKQSLLQSAWRHVYDLYGLEAISSATDKRRYEQMFSAPPPFTVENIRDAFGDLISDPWGSVLRGMAEVFAQLDPAFKSHEKMKIGVKGLPKRVILSNVTGYGSWGRDRLRDILNALAAYQGKPLIEYREIEALMRDGEALLEAWTAPGDGHRPEVEFPPRGVWLKRFANGNGHLFFDLTTLRDINRALAEYYGDVLPDCPEDRPARQCTGTDVSKDLQYYPTPVAVVERVLAEIKYRIEGQRVLEPSCGCGRFMDALRAVGADVVGCEVDPVRAAMCEAKGHRIMRMNFLDTAPTPDFDRVVMNPPFAGRHYAKHVRHALRFLKPGGTLTAILPATARYDHGELDDLRPHWDDLPVGSFTESGTNINTTVATIHAPKEKRRD
ncbi:Methyltransferase domain-containing protein [Paracoccus alcaliphilus]|uniref:Methyltransferase domain-containing protein n=1 Tax=Paracoccus alcaliphilus TaxID=34002 RepID=A0A1H8NMM0_9RHOB|nr:DUF4942 domain-containing protein [Paracoccus alcaliphilus]WCR17487.1 DUF4942 domain-containing protein [Paracoccus alcaliphilus]SEO30827.1 Methyltransferase domain-containing protein [Paracoccus alcaliphilus]